MLFILSLFSWLQGFFCFFILHVCRGNSFPKPLSEAKEQKYLALYKAGDTNARNKLVEHNLRLVAHIIKKYYTNESDHDDLVSIGTIGLIKAINTYNSEKGIKLSSYASRCIENEILMHFRNSRKSSQDMSLDDSIDTDKDGNPLSLIDILATNDNIEENLELKDNLSKLNGFIEETLDDRSKEIIYLRYGLNGLNPLTQQEVAKKLGISRSYISRIEKKALETLRKRYDKGD